MSAMIVELRELLIQKFIIHPLLQEAMKTNCISWQSGNGEIEIEAELLETPSDAENQEGFLGGTRISDGDVIIWNPPENARLFDLHRLSDDSDLRIFFRYYLILHGDEAYYLEKTPKKLRVIPEYEYPFYFGSVLRKVIDQANLPQGK